MNHYTIDQIKIGDEVSFTYEITEEKMNMFMQITGDSNPLHIDLEYAKNKGYNDKVVYGMLTSSILSTLAGMYMPGEFSLIHTVEINFIKPVFLSSSPLKVEAKVVEVDNRFNTIKLKYSIINNNLEKVVRGYMKIGFTNM